MQRLPELKLEICELYYATGSLKTEGLFDLSVHKDNANHPHPRSPWYMHYPDIETLPRQEAGRLQKLFDMIGLAFFEIRELLVADPAVDISPQPHRLGPIPRGSIAIGEAFARHYDPTLRNVEHFEKIVAPGKPIEFIGPDREVEPGEELESLDDHTTSANHHRKFVRHGRARGFLIRHAFTVVERQQGGIENLAAMGVGLHPILVADELLSFGLEHGHVIPEKFAKIQAYRIDNPI